MLPLSTTALEFLDVYRYHVHASMCALAHTCSRMYMLSLARARAHTHTHTYARTHALIHTQKHTAFSYTQMCSSFSLTRVCMRANTHMYSCIYVCICPFLKSNESEKCSALS